MIIVQKKQYIKASVGDALLQDTLKDVTYL